MGDVEHLQVPASPDQRVILVVDDESVVVNIARITLEAAGFLVLTACDGEQALQVSREFPGPIHALVSDIIMPKLDGVALSEQLLCERPKIKVLLMSGQVEQPVEGRPFMAKPFQLEELKQRVRQLLARADAA
jgi:DNA-binding response OmpR family regulator